jgi:hypothetical protein
VAEGAGAHSGGDEEPHPFIGGGQLQYLCGSEELEEGGEGSHIFDGELLDRRTGQAGRLYFVSYCHCLLLFSANNSQLQHLVQLLPHSLARVLSFRYFLKTHYCLLLAGNLLLEVVDG